MSLGDLTPAEFKIKSGEDERGVGGAVLQYSAVRIFRAGQGPRQPVTSCGRGCLARARVQVRRAASGTCSCGAGVIVHFDLSPRPFQVVAHSAGGCR
jgi:hypothetical protein